MRILFIGDVVGRSGRAIVSERLPKLVRDWKLDLVIVNGENAAGGFGITETIYQDFVDAGIDHLVVDRLGDAEAAGGVLAIDDDAVERPVAPQRGQALEHGRTAGPPHHITDEQKTHSAAAKIDCLAFR